METTTDINRVQTLLKYTYGIIPIVAGADKFLNLLANWSDYLSPAFTNMLPFSGSTFMMIVGVIEIIAGLLVLARPAIGGYVVCAWLVLIAISILVSGQHFDTAVRDLVMAVGAFTLAKLSQHKGETQSAMA
ncbi:MAG: hypothetical protein M3R17_11340 [Bacteroidota bacterium]|nr:hypothetical protein [Bacteroidota bacterium]